MKLSQKTRIYFLVKDPHWAFVWWTISHRSIEAAVPLCKWGRPSLVLRVHDITDILFDGNNSHMFFDVVIDGYVNATRVSHDTDHWYLPLSVSDRTYCAELALTWGKERSFRIALSTPLSLPRDSPSHDAEER